MINIAQLLEKHEGFRGYPYHDSVGKLTIGIGRNLIDRGITKAEAMYMLENDIADFTKQLSDRLYWFDTAPPDVKAVMVDMTFNMGLNGFLQFHKALEHLKNENYKMAADEILNSLWAKQVGTRAIELSDILKNI